MDNNQSSKQGVAPPEVEKKFKSKIEEIKLKEEEQAVEAEAYRQGWGYMNLTGFPVASETLSLIPKEIAIRYKVIPFFSDQKTLNLAMANYSEAALREVRRALGRPLEIKIFLISPHSFAKAIKLYESLPKIKKAVSGITITQKDLEKFRQQISGVADLSKKITTIPLTQILSMVLAGAVKSRASDVHFEAEEKDVKLRFRIDGVLQDIAVLPANVLPKIVSRVKLLSGLKINISDRPQDGRVTLVLSDDTIDVRVSTLPTTHGEDMVLRLLLASSLGFAFDQLGIRGSVFKKLEKEIHKPHGLIVTTGPTGSGKTTTLYAILNKLNQPETKILTLEDPIEYRLEGINQSQVDKAKGYTYAKGLKAILRQDPDIIMVGEIRDLETAEISLQATLTGHLVVSTLHTNNAAEAIPRFLSLGVKSFLLAPALKVAMAQRLVRKICEKCKVEDKLDKETYSKVLELLKSIPSDSGEKIDTSKKLTFYTGKGCPDCQNIGYFSRTGIFEIIISSPEIEKLTLSEKAPEFEIQKAAVKAGMITMAQDGILKALDGITSVEEVFRVAG